MKLYINGEEIDNRTIQSCIYNDYSGGRADSIQVTISDENNVWRNSSLQKGSIVKSETDTVQSGTMYISQLSYISGTCIIKALSTNQLALNDASYLRNRITTEEIIKEVANELQCSYKLYNVNSFSYVNVQRINERATRYLCERMALEGYLCKMFDGCLIVYSEKEFENRAPVITLAEEDFIYHPRFSTSDDLIGCVENTYNNIKTIVYSGCNGKTIKRNIPVSTIDESERFSRNIMRSYNKNEFTGSGVISDMKVVAGDVVKLDGTFGLFNGNNFVFRVSHNLKSGNKNIYFRKPIEGDY